MPSPHSAALAACLIASLASGAISKDLCAPVINPRVNRQIDVQFLGKRVSVLGHQHFSGRDRETSLEFDLLALLDDPQKTIADFGGPAATKARLEAYLRRDAKAVRYWRDDLARLRTMIRAGEVASVFIEYGPNLFRKRTDTRHAHFVTGSRLLPELGFTPEQTDDLLMITLTPAYYLKETEPDLVFEVRSAEPSEAEIKAYDRDVCPAAPPSAPTAVTTLKSSPAEAAAQRRLEKKWRQRGFTRAQIEGFVTAGLEATVAFFNANDVNDTMNDQIVDAFASALPFRLTPGERAEVERLAGLPEDTQFEDYLKRLPARLSEVRRHPGCWGRESIIARRVMDTPGNSVLVMGGEHLATLSSALGRACEGRLDPPAK